MRYDEARRKIKTGDLLCWFGEHNGNIRHDIEVDLVRLATSSEFGHVGIALEMRGRLFVMDITTKGCAPRLLSSDPPDAWVAAPRTLSESALDYAFERFGVMVYSRWQAFLGWARRLVIGNDMLGECAEFVLEVYRASNMSPGNIATPAGVISDALTNWPGASLRYIVERSDAAAAVA